MSVDRYKQISKIDSDFDSPFLISHTPTLREEDYLRTYITRYFIQKANDENAVITEINYKTFTQFSYNPFYNVIQLNWVIVGDEVEVREKNKKSILYASKNMKAISLYLQNPIQFLKK
jgi:hypothetical protein